MTVLREVIETPLAIDRAFAYVADFANSQEWDPGVASSTRIDDGPVTAGARYQLQVTFNGRTLPMLYAVTEFDAPRRVVLHGSGSRIEAVDSIDFAPTPTGGSRVTYEADLRLRGILRLAEPFLGRAFDSIGKRALAGMQRELDRRADTGSAGGTVVGADEPPPVIPGA